jgi:hypothetical protein
MPPERAAGDRAPSQEHYQPTRSSELAAGGLCCSPGQSSGREQRAHQQPCRPPLELEGSGPRRGRDPDQPERAATCGSAAYNAHQAGL